MVDWVLEAARPLGPEPLVVIASPESRDAFGDVKVAVQERALGTGDAVRAARSAVGDEPTSLLVLSGDTPLLTTELLEQLVETHRREERGRDRSHLRARGRALLRPDRPGGRRHRRGDRGGRRRDARAARAPRVQLLDLRLPDRSALAGPRPARAAQRAGRALPDRRRPRSRRAAASASLLISPPIPPRPRA